MSLFVYAVLLLPSLCFSQVKVAFLEVRTRDGKNLQLEKNTQFAHVAISYNGQWLHTHPYRGVELVNRRKLEEIGVITAVIDIPDYQEPRKVFVESILGTPYEITFSWESDRYYCSKLVGKILGLEAEPMNFDAPGWPEKFKKYNGLPGISPQGVFNQLVKRGYPVRKPTRCENVFE